MPEKPKRSLSLNLFRIKGIPIRLHASFFLLLLWVWSEESSRGAPAGPELLFVSAIFGCVLLHELAHALVARFYGIRTSHITLYPFGGVAALNGNPKPKAELLIAAAGPASNFVIAALLFPWLTLESFGFTAEQFDSLADEALLPAGPISLGARLFAANILLAVFNLLPALPMDGGRILRSVLMLLKVRSSTAWATRISKALCLLLMLAALANGEPILLIIAVFVFLGASQEQFYERARAAAENRTVRDIMLSRERVITLTHGSTIGEAARDAVHTNQSVFPVLHGEELLGSVSRQRLLTAGLRIREGLEHDAYIAEIMERSSEAVLEDTPLLALLSSLSSRSASAIVVLDRDGRFAGLLERERLLEFFAGARGARRPEGTTAPDQENPPA